MGSTGAEAAKPTIADRIAQLFESARSHRCRVSGEEIVSHAGEQVGLRRDLGRFGGGGFSFGQYTNACALAALQLATQRRRQLAQFVTLTKFFQRRGFLSRGDLSTGASRVAITPHPVADRGKSAPSAQLREITGAHSGEKLPCHRPEVIGIRVWQTVKAAVVIEKCRLGIDARAQVDPLTRVLGRSENNFEGIEIAGIEIDPPSA